MGPGLWIIVAFETVHLGAWRRAGQFSLNAVMNAVREVDHETYEYKAMNNRFSTCYSLQLCSNKMTT